MITSYLLAHAEVLLQRDLAGDQDGVADIRAVGGRDRQVVGAGLAGPVLDVHPVLAHDLRAELDDLAAYGELLAAQAALPGKDLRRRSCRPS